MRIKKKKEYLQAGLDSSCTGNPNENPLPKSKMTREKNDIDLLV